jgi:hypothetical protein
MVLQVTKVDVIVIVTISPSEKALTLQKKRKAVKAATRDLKINIARI